MTLNTKSKKNCIPTKTKKKQIDIINEIF